MQNENTGFPAGELSVIAATSEEPKSRVVAIEDGTVVVTDDTEVQSNAPIVVDPALERGPTIKSEVVIRDRPKPRVHVGHVGHLSRSGPLRGRQIASALGLALAAASKTVSDFPKAPEKKGGKKQKERFFPKNATGLPKDRPPQHRFKGPSNTKGAARHSRGGNRGK